jgi:hypothetical protein
MRHSTSDRLDGQAGATPSRGRRIVIINAPPRSGVCQPLWMVPARALTSRPDFTGTFFIDQGLLLLLTWSQQLNGKRNAYANRAVNRK